MRNERGFFTIAGLCLLLAVALCIQGVQEFEENYSVGATSFQIEHELQNAAESALVEAAEKNNLPPYNQYGANDTYQREIEVSTPKVSDRLKNFSIKVIGERAPFARYNRSYSKDTEADFKDKPAADGNHDWVKRTTVIISVASCDSNFIGGRIYRRAMAYVIDDDPETKNIDESAVIHFLNGSTTKFNGW